ncbi:hypothetical protein D9613_010377 [Agrocybe pediades]|uniref:EF-hand domain-containing protein n=1 Tax=Agrocybe pediades TaxID=84607 RepID=A0A8H4QFJ8_9AGAR|nr:hypothetical protein D9613_010377 [Agrocybe pediades]
MSGHVLPPLSFDSPSLSPGIDINLAVSDIPPSADETTDAGRPVRPTLQPNFSSSSSVTTTLEKNHEEFWKKLTRFYDDNEEVINKSIAMDLEAAAKDEKTAEVQMAIDTFVETANVVLEGLAALANVHPILGAAIFAFHSIMRLDLARRDNNNKVLAIKLQMQNMMCTMFQLRNLRHVHVKEGVEREQEKERLHRLIGVIAGDITKCGSDLNYYMDPKLLNATAYERKFRDHIKTFVRHRSELQNTITAYIAAGIDAANIAISDLAQKVDKMDTKLDVFIEKLFRKLDTSLEGELLSLIRICGAKECLSKDEVLTQLLTKAGESLDNNKLGPKRKRELLAEFRRDLNKELRQNLDDVLSQNLGRFEKLLNLQSNNMERISAQLQHYGFQHNDNSMKLDKLVSTSILILEEGKLIKKAVVSNSKVKLKDPEFQQIWDRMGLRRSVKATKFVLTFRDHLLSDRSMPGTPYTAQVNQGNVSSLLTPSTPMAGNELLSTPGHLRPDVEQDLWVFDYINVQHVQPIVEAMDEDGSGFISVKEANNFALARPKGMNLLHWIAYWAVGWHINLTYYYHKIYTTMIEMHESLKFAHPANRSYVEIYLNYYYFLAIEGVLRSIKVLPDDARHEPKLVEIAENIRILQEQRLSANLNEISFLLESPENVRLVVGTGRAEAWFLPLVYLLLQRHLAIIKLAKTRVISGIELAVHSTSFMHIFNVFEERSRDLKVIFMQVYREADAQFGNHAYGMFYNTYKGMSGLELNNKLLYYKDSHGIGYELAPPEVRNPETDPIEGAEEDKDKDKAEPVDISILNQRPDDNFSYEEVDIGLPPPAEHAPQPIEFDSEAPNPETGPTKGTEDRKEKDKRKPVDIFILNHKPDDNFSFEEVDIGLPPPPADHNPHPIEGAWMGVCYRSTNPVVAFRGCFELAIGPVLDSKIVGRARSYLGKLDLNGKIRPPSTAVDTEGADGENATEFDVVFKLTAETFTDIWCKGTYDSFKETISGEWLSPAECDSDDIWEFPSGKALSERSHGTFLITRTPADVYRFRRVIDCPTVQPSWSIAKRRWCFALNAVRLRTRGEMNSSKVIKSQLEERARWIELAARDYLDSDLLATRGHLSDEGRQKIFTLTWILPPAVSAIYEALAIFLYNRMIYHCGLMVCDVCDQRITFTRFVCITCVEDDFSNQVDLCTECITSRSFSQKRTFVHHLSHSLIRSTVRLHYCEMATLILQARSLSERIKTSFTAASKKPGSSPEMGTKLRKYSNSTAHEDPEMENIVTSLPSLTPLVCACCLKDLTLPCWACVKCELDTLFCLECELINAPVLPREFFSGIHTRKHPLLRINDSLDVKTDVEPKTARLERRLAEMEERLGAGIDEGLSALEEKVNIRLDAIQSELKVTTAKEVARLIDNSKNRQDALSSPPDHSSRFPPHSPTGALDHCIVMSPLPTVYESRLEERLLQLEAKVDNQFGRMLLLIQEIVARMAPATPTQSKVEET